jgi:hypothetical protein
MSVSCECCVLSGRALCDGLIPRPEESYRMWCVSNVCDHETSTKREGPDPYRAVEPWGGKCPLFLIDRKQTCTVCSGAEVSPRYDASVSSHKWKTRHIRKSTLVSKKCSLHCLPISLFVAHARSVRSMMFKLHHSNGGRDTV